MTDVLIQPLFEWQIERAVSALAIGGCLGAVGSALQRLLNNDLADPFLLGISGSAVLGAISLSLIAPIVWASSVQDLLMLYLLGALAGGGLVLFLLVWAKGRVYHSVHGLILFGVVINAFCSALTLLLMSFDNPLYPKIDYTWFVGRIESYGLKPTLVLVVLSLSGVFIIYSARQAIERFPYGQHVLKRVGFTSSKLEFRVLFAVWLAVSTVSAFCGALGFIGLMVPHIARRLTTRYGAELVWSYLIGGVSLLAADYLARRLAYPRVLPVGLLTSVSGAVCLALVLRRSAHRHV